MKSFALHVTHGADTGTVFGILNNHGFASSDEAPRLFAFMGAGDAASAWKGAKSALLGAGIASTEAQAFDRSTWVTVAPAAQRAATA